MDIKEEKTIGVLEGLEEQVAKKYLRVLGNAGTSGRGCLLEHVPASETTSRPAPFLFPFSVFLFSLRQYMKSCTEVESITLFPACQRARTILQHSYQLQQSYT